MFQSLEGLHKMVRPLNANAILLEDEVELLVVEEDNGLRVIGDKHGDDNDVLIEYSEEGMRVLFHPGGSDAVIGVTFLKDGKVRVEQEWGTGEQVEYVRH